MHRRAALLAAASAAAALAGCSNTTGDEDTTTGTTRETTPESTIVTATDTTRTTTSTPTTTTERPTGTELDEPGATPAARALEITELYPVEGTMVVLGAGGTARNAADRALANCTIQVTGRVAEETYTATASRASLAPGDTWEWEAAFDREASHHEDDGVTLLSATKTAEIEGE
ncbi:MAG: hypothetical protein ABEJ88_10005 [Halobacterium sp.]